nr:cytochrome P450 315a1 [Geocoris pallidipennis]
MSGRTIPSVRGLPSAIQLMLSGGPQKLHLYVDNHHRKLGPVYKDTLGGLSGVFLADPRAARAVFAAEGPYPKHVIPPPWILYNQKYSCKRGLFFMDGQEWHRYRQIMNPIFLKKNLSSSLGEVYNVITDSLLQNLSGFQDKEIENLENILYTHSISFTIGSLIGSAYLENKEFFGEDIGRLGSITNAIFQCTAELMNFPLGLAASLKLPVWKNFVNAVDSSLVASRKLTEKMLKIKLNDGILKDMLIQNLDVSILQSLILDLMLAAGDTTAFTTQWALYLLSKNPSAVDSLRRDNSLARGVLRETLRLYPAAIFLSRYIQEDLYILDYIIPKDELVVISLYTIGRLESVYPEAENFKPERWLRTNAGHLKGVNEPMAYFPFALGARSCIGRKLAEAQIYQTITKIFSKYDVVLEEDVDMELQMVPVPKKPLRLRLAKISR